MDVYVPCYFFPLHADVRARLMMLHCTIKGKWFARIVALTRGVHGYINQKQQSKCFSNAGKLRFWAVFWSVSCCWKRRSISKTKPRRCLVSVPCTRHWRGWCCNVVGYYCFYFVLFFSSFTSFFLFPLCWLLNYFLYPPFILPSSNECNTRNVKGRCWLIGARCLQLRWWSETRITTWKQGGVQTWLPFCLKKRRAAPVQVGLVVVVVDGATSCQCTRWQRTTILESAAMQSC